jgi:hypothetical protein
MTFLYNALNASKRLLRSPLILFHLARGQPSRFHGTKDRVRCFCLQRSSRSSNADEDFGLHTEVSSCSIRPTFDFNGHNDDGTSTTTKTQLYLDQLSWSTKSREDFPHPRYVPIWCNAV